MFRKIGNSGRNTNTAERIGRLPAIVGSLVRHGLLDGKANLLVLLKFKRIQWPKYAVFEDGTNDLRHQTGPGV